MTIHLAAEVQNFQQVVCCIRLLKRAAWTGRIGSTLYRVCLSEARTTVDAVVRASAVEAVDR